MLIWCMVQYHDIFVDRKWKLNNWQNIIFSQIKEAQMTKQKLMSNRAKLEADIKIKDKSLKIDQHQCLSSRKTFPAITLTKNLWIVLIKFLRHQCKIDTRQLKSIISIKTFIILLQHLFNLWRGPKLFNCTYWQ